MGLKPFVAIDLEGRLTDISGPLVGMKSEDAREAAIQILTETGRLESSEKRMQEVPVSERGETQLRSFC